MKFMPKNLQSYIEELNRTELNLYEKIKVLQDSGFENAGITRSFRVGHNVGIRIKNNREWSDFLYMTSKVKLQKKFTSEEKRIFLQAFPQNTYIQILEYLSQPELPNGARYVVIAKHIARKRGRRITKGSNGDYEGITGEIDDLLHQEYILVNQQLRHHYKISPSGRKAYGRMHAVYKRAKIGVPAVPRI